MGTGFERVFVQPHELFYYHCYHYDDRVDKKGKTIQKACKYLCDETVKDMWGDEDLESACNCTSKIVGSVKKAQKECVRGVRFL